jgi:hypothetical protein
MGATVRRDFEDLDRDGRHLRSVAFLTGSGAGD